MATKHKPSWEDINFVKRKIKKKKTEEKLKKLQKTENSSSPSDNKAEEVANENTTLSIAVPGSILDNTQSAELRTYVAGQIARAACIYQVDEVMTNQITQRITHRLSYLFVNNVIFIPRLSSIMTSVKKLTTLIRLRLMRKKHRGLANSWRLFYNTWNVLNT